MKVLFLVTKHYPYGGAEAYLEHEREFLCKVFDKIYLVPAERFGQSGSVRSLPEKMEVLHINEVSYSKLKFNLLKRIVEFCSVIWHDWRLSGFSLFFFKKFRKHISVLRHQQKTADTAGFTILKHKKSGDEVFCYAYWMHYGALMLSLLKRRTIIKSYAVRAHSIDLYHKDWYLAKLFGTAPLCFHFYNQKMATRIFSVSEHGKNYLIQKFPNYKAKISTSYLGVPAGKLTEHNKQDYFLIVSCSHLTPNKRVDKIPDILKFLHFPVRWVHFGGGNDEKLKALKDKTIGLPSNIQVELRGNTPNHEVMNYYAHNNVDLFLNISMAEGLPVSLMEAISFGIPVMATEVYGTPELANDQTGFLIPRDFIDSEVAKLINDFNTDLAKKVSIRKSARKYFIETFLADTNYPAFIKEILKHPA